MKKIAMFLFTICCFAAAFAQPGAPLIIKGKLSDRMSGEPIIGASVLLKESFMGTLSDSSGRFQLSVPSFPATLEISHVSFEKKEVQVQSTGEISIALQPFSPMLTAVVTSPNRMPTKYLQSPVTIETIGPLNIHQLPAPSVYDATAFLKGVDQTSSSLTFKTPGTRGFNGSGSTRVNQVVDGMDNQAPGMNFFVGNFAGLTDLDIQSVELLPGASSALYGPGGMNGTILINSKNPFLHQGLSVQAKEGVMHLGKSARANASSYSDFAIRWAKAFKNKFAFRLSGQYLRATDWLASDTSDYARSGSNGKLVAGTRQTDPNYDGVNVYGDETSLNIKDIAKRMVDLGLIPPAALDLIPNQKVSRTGYNEMDIIDPSTKNIKLSGAMHYKFNDRLEAQLAGNWANGNTVYTGNNRFALKDIRIGQYKLELKHRDWFLRSFTTQEDAGQAYSATTAAQILNEAWKPSGRWYPQYVGGFLQAKMSGANDETAHTAARGYADQGRPDPGSDQFRQLLDSVRHVPIPRGGLFFEKSQLWMTEGQYNFSKLVKFVDIIAGINYKRYILDSKGTLFIDTAGPIRINETGGYAQASKKLFNEKLQLSVSGRYDKNENFKGRFTPRATAVVEFAKNNNLRFSYQTAYRFPSTQQQWIRLNVGDYEILGGLDWIVEYMHLKDFPAVDIATGKPFEYKKLQPETMRSFEVGYRGMINNKLLVDAYSYFGKYENFLGRLSLFQPTTGKVYSVVQNSDTRVKTYGFGLGLDYRLPGNYSVFANGYSDVITDVPTGFQSYFNTPKYRFNAGIANDGMGKKKRIGFSVQTHWQDQFFWEGELANGPVSAFITTDAQVSYKLPKIRSVVRIGGTNILNHYYQNGYGNPMIGGLYYAMFGYNIF